MSVDRVTVVEADGRRVELPVHVRRCFNLGFTMRDAEKMQRHLEEIYRLGMPELHCERPPLVMPISAWAVTTAAQIDVQRPRTSGEVEIVTMVTDSGDILVGVGSDHTDRSLETIDIPWAKQVAPNVVAPDLWRWTDVQGHWDQVRMDCWVVDGGERVHYQSASVAEFWTPPEMVEGVRRSVVPAPGTTVLLSGTVVSLEERVRFGEAWTLRMSDPVLGREIVHSYTVTVLSEEILEDGSATGDVAKATSLVGD